MKYLKVFENNGVDYQSVLNAQQKIDDAESLVIRFLEVDFKDINISFQQSNIYVEYIDNDGQDNFEVIEDEDFVDFIQFLKSPELWTQTKKYNL